MYIAAIDPGRDKCGFAVLRQDTQIAEQRVIATKLLEQEVCSAVSKYELDVLILGNGTTSRSAQQRLRSSVPALQVLVVDEYRTTELAKKEYWKVHPPMGWRRFLPTSMQVPPVPVDDFVAVLLAKRYLFSQQPEKGTSKIPKGDSVDES